MVRTTSIPEATGVRVIHTLAALGDGHCDADLLTNRVPGIAKKRPMMCLLAVARFHVITECMLIDVCFVMHVMQEPQGEQCCALMGYSWVNMT